MMEPIKFYYLSFKNITKYFSSVEDNNKLLIFSRVPLLNRIRKKVLQTIIYKICTWTEPFVSLLIVFGLFPFYIIKTICTRKQPLGKELYFEIIPLLKDRVIAAKKYESATDWIYSIDIPKTAWDQSKRCHSLFEFVSLWNVIQAFVLSIFAILGAQLILRFKYVFRTYNSFEFFICYFVLKNISSDITICFCNQIDRWAILFDNAPQKNKILFQHGIEMPTADWPVKFENIDTVYVLSEEESLLLFKASFKNIPKNVITMGPTIQLTQLDFDDSFKILIVGFPSYVLFDKELALVQAFAQDGYTVYLKPHPSKEDMTKYVNIGKKYKNCRIILGKIFPDVDVVCSYRSTLAVEYQAHNKFVMMYDDYSVDEMIERITDLQNNA